MRRKDREVQNNQEIFAILQRCSTVRIAMQGASYPYVIPVSFGFEVVNGKAVIYFHCARKGLKLERLEANPFVCVESDRFLGVEKTAHGLTARYESVIGFGTCRFVHKESEVLHGLKLLTEHYGWQNEPVERCGGLQHLLVGKIVLDEIYGKRNLPESPSAE